MKLTKSLKNYAIDKLGVKPDAVDAEFTKAVVTALAEDSLTVEEFQKLTKSEEEDLVGGFKSFMHDLGSTLGDLREALLEDTKGSCGDKKPPSMKEDEEDMEEEEKKIKDPAKETPSKASLTSLQKMVVGNRMSGLEDGEKSINIRVKEAADQYSSTKSAMTFPQTTEKGRAHPLAGRPVMDYSDPSRGGRGIDTPSELDKAVAGSWSKFIINAARLRSKTFAFQQLPQHDKELVLYAMDNMKWSGASDGGDFADIKDRRLSPHEQKALIDDSSSGGLEAAPIVFDDQVIQTPLLNGELFPLVTSIPLDRGRRVEGVATGTVTGSWGGVDDTSISLFDTTSYVTAFDTTIFRWEGAIRIGLDFLSDTPIDFAQHVTSQYGERLLEDLDDVIATGNGTTQPEGVTVKAGTTSVSFGGSTTIGAYESLRFGVAKAEHRANLARSAVFCGSETSYQRAKAIPVGASDARRLSNTTNMPNYDDYSWMDRPYKINESLGNTKIFYAILARYRMYRRRGLTIRTSTEGDTLIRRNEMLMVAMARYGGHLERGAVAAVTSTAPA